MCELIDDFGLVHFGTLDIGSRESVARVLRDADRAIGYVTAQGEDARVRVRTWGKGWFSVRVPALAAQP